MGMILKELGRVAYVTADGVATAQTLVTNATSFDTVVSHIVLHNTHTSAIVVTLCKVPNSGSSVGTGDINDEYWQQSIAASDTRTVDIPMYLTGINDTIQIYAATASKVNAYAFGFTMADQT